MRAVLTTQIPVHRVAVFAEMAWMERRPELGLLCRRAREHGNRISVTAVHAALPGLSEAGANNIMAWCHLLGLCDKHGGLTKTGELVAESDEAAVPEQGVYGMWLVDHPVLGRRVLAAERLSSSRDVHLDELRPLPVVPEQGTVFRSVRDPKERFVVRSLPTNGETPAGVLGETRATCRLRWTLDFEAGHDRWQLEGTMEAPQSQGKHATRPLQHEPESDGLDLWNLATTWAHGPLLAFGRWNATERRLAVAFQGLAHAELETFRKSLPVGRLEVPGKGTYECPSLEDVPIGPVSERDAQHWAMARLERRLAERPYWSRAEVRNQFAELTEGTPLEPFSPELPAHAALLDRPKDPARFWALAAPVDLAPYPVNADDLGALQIGNPVLPASRVSAHGVVRVPYRASWSMREFVARLLADAAPRRVLLCDPFVRGEANLATLALLVKALRADDPSVIVDVWTQETEADFPRIQGITGGVATKYRGVFGAERFHDRYLLIVPSHGDGFGWHMSNSPLHARMNAPGASAESPLRWRDLLAIRVKADELAPPLRSWFGGGR